MAKTIDLEKQVKVKGAEIAGELKAYFRERGVFAVNLIGSPGAGKTSLLEALAPHLQGRAAVIEGDLQTDEDKIRIEKCGLPAYEINTVAACHLDAGMVKKALDEFSIDGMDYLFIENVGNLVCPASLEIGEDIKVAVVSVTEGDDKPAKYPTAIRVSSAMIITKTDLLPHVQCDPDRMERDAKAARPDIQVFRTSAVRDEGIQVFLTWLEQLKAIKP